MNICLALQRKYLALGLTLLLTGCSQQTTGQNQSENSKTTQVSVNSENPGKPSCCCDELDRSKLLVAAQKEAGGESSPKDGWPLFGGTPARNMVNLNDKNIPTDWSVEEGKLINIKWVADLGSKAYGGPVISGGRVFVGTNNGKPRDSKITGTKAVLMCFQESDGKFLWQAVHDVSPEPLFKDVVDTNMGLLSTPVVEGKRLYYVLSQAVVVCTDVDTGKTLWEFDMRKELKVVPYHCSNSSPLVAGNNVFLITGNGIDGENLKHKLHSPEAPSFLALNKETGKVAWTSNLPGDKVIEGQWSNPAYAVINGKPQVIFPGGDAVLYSLEPDTGKLIWKFNCHPKKTKKDDDRIDNYIVSTPVIHDNKVYIGLGLYPEHPSGTRFSYFLCVDATKTGDVSPGTSLDPKALDNKDSALVWAYGGAIEPRPKTGRPVVFGRTISTCAVVQGLVYIPEENGYMHCLDAKTGQRQWMYDFKTGIWGSPYYVDGKIYIGTEDGEVVIFQAGKDLKVINKVDMTEVLHSTPVVTNGVLYVVTRGKLWAIAEKK
jgi:outer membrane protein assembly factor BamB